MSNTNTLEIRLRRLDEIKPLPGNARRHDLESIKKKIQDHGFLDPIGVSAGTGHNLDGNGRLESLKLLYAAGEPAPKNIVVRREKVESKMVNVWYAPTVDINVDLETEQIIAASLNKAHDDGKTDERALFSILEQAAAFGRLEQTGYDQSLFDALGLKYAPPPEFDMPEQDHLSAPSDQTGGHAPSGTVTAPAGEQGAPPPSQLAPSHVRMVQLFLNSDTHPVFLDRCQRLIEANRIRKDDGNFVENPTDLVFALVRDADTNT